jgi:hypothetical protein
MTEPSNASQQHPDDRQDEMRRLQTGAIGIVAVLLLIGLAGTLGSRGNSAAQAPTVAGAAQAAAANDPSKNAPLVELGVQPATQNDAAKTVAPKNAAPQSPALTPMPPSEPVPVRADGSVPDLKPDPKAQKAVRPN